jgi:PPK2 family polyphosphate:nucleotide phosphotransferase
MGSKKDARTAVKAAKQARKAAVKAAKDAAAAARHASARAEQPAEVVVPQPEVAPQGDVGALLRVAPGTSLADVDPGATPGFEGGDKKAGAAALAALDEEVSELQERLYAQGRAGGDRRVLLVLQGMDTSGKGGVMRSVVDLMDPQGVAITAFKAPTEEERAHDFLWRIERALPRPGTVGVFDRSHYEDVLIARVRQLADEAELDRRHDAINDFERRLVEGGCAIVKCVLHISKDEQKQRLLDRLADPSKHWKYNPGDVDERARWDDYQRAYDVVLARNNTDVAPMHVVPANAKWYRNWAICRLLLDELRAMDLQWPAADFNVHAEMARVQAS